MEENGRRASLSAKFMRLRTIFLLILLLMGSGCGMLPLAESTPPTAGQLVAPATAVAEVTLPPTVTAVPPTAPPAPTPTATPLPPDLSIRTEDVYLYPVPEIYSGDLVTFQVLANVPERLNGAEVSVHILVDYEEIDSGTLSRPNLAGDSVALFEWAWDTTDAAGEHLIHVILDRYDMVSVGDENRDNNQVSFVVEVLDAGQLSAAERNATWVTAQTDCCVVHVVSGTAAYRDLPELLVTIEEAAAQAVRKLDEPLQRKLEIYLVDRVIGQGGYAGNAMVLSYLDRQYANNGFYEVTVHEMTHLIDRQFAPQRITFLAEGVAVWAAGGHYKAEDLQPRAAALLQIGEFIPLAALINDFYPVQHEIGYLQAAGLVDYLINEYGWPAVRAFYSDVQADDAGTPAEAVDLNMQIHFGRTLAEMEAAWLAELEGLTVERAAVIDLQTTLRYYELMRRYQQLYDPTAYFLTAWLPYPQLLREEGNPADFTRHPETELNITLEAMLQAADLALRAGDFNRANVILDSVMRVLDSQGEFVDPLAIHYRQVVMLAAEAGYEVQTIRLDGDFADVQATEADSTALVNLEMVLNGQDWVLLNN
jgi:hypothetical protein